MTVYLWPSDIFKSYEDLISEHNELICGFQRHEFKAEVSLTEPLAARRIYDVCYL